MSSSCRFDFFLAHYKQVKWSLQTFCKLLFCGSKQKSTICQLLFLAGKRDCRIFAIELDQLNSVKQGALAFGREVRGEGF